MKIVMNGDAGIIHAYCIHIVSSYISNVYDIYTCGLELGMCVLGGALFPPKNESTTWNACTPQVLTFFGKYVFFCYH